MADEMTQAPPIPAPSLPPDASKIQAGSYTLDPNSTQSTQSDVPNVAIDEATGIVEPLEEPKAPTPTKEERDFSARFAALAKKEKAILDRERVFKEQSAKMSKLEKLLASSKEDPLALLNEAGISLDQIVQSELKKNKTPTVEDKLMSIEEKIAAYEKQIETQKQAEQDRKLNEAIGNFKNTIKTTVTSGADKYELIAANDAYDDVYSVCEQYFAETGKQLPVDKACELVENELFESVKKYQNLNKFKSLFEKPSQPASAPAPETKPAQRENRQEPRTLTNNIPPATVVGEENPFLSREESLKRAAALIKWK